MRILFGGNVHTLSWSGLCLGQMEIKRVGGRSTLFLGQPRILFGGKVHTLSWANAGWGGVGVGWEGPNTCLGQVRILAALHAILYTGKFCNILTPYEPPTSPCIARMYY